MAKLSSNFKKLIKDAGKLIKDVTKTSTKNGGKK